MCFPETYVMFNGGCFFALWWSLAHFSVYCITSSNDAAVSVTSCLHASADVCVWGLRVHYSCRGNQTWSRSGVIVSALTCQKQPFTEVCNWWSWSKKAPIAWIHLELQRNSAQCNCDTLKSCLCAGIRWNANCDTTGGVIRFCGWASRQGSSVYPKHTWGFDCRCSKAYRETEKESQQTPGEKLSW